MRFAGRGVVILPRQWRLTHAWSFCSCLLCWLCSVPFRLVNHCGKAQWEHDAVKPRHFRLRSCR